MAQVSKIGRIVIASVLKPATETRMFEKIGSSLAESGEFEVHIIGFPSEEVQNIKYINFHHHSPTQFSRISINRYLASWRILSRVLRIKPDVLLITTHELLVIGTICKMILKCRLIYDVQENYFRNIWYTTAFPPILRNFIALWVRVKELVLSPFVNHFTLAEAGYAQELPFVKPFTVLQNKLSAPHALSYQKKEKKGYSNLLFSGTLAETTGLYDAIDLTKKLHALDSAINLTIVGHCPSSSDYHQLENISGQNSFIQFKGSLNPLPHTEILKAIHQSDFGIIIYPHNPSTACSIPTKLFEYLGLCLPVLIRHNNESHELVRNSQGGLVLSDSPNHLELLNQLKELKLPAFNKEWYWDIEKQVLADLIKNI